MADQRVGGTLQLQINGAIQDAKGNFSYNIGRAKRDAVVGADRVHGYKEVPQVPFIEGEITDHPDVDLKALLDTKDATIFLTLANGKGCTLYHAWYAGEGTVTTEEGAIPVRFESKTADEVA